MLRATKANENEGCCYFFFFPLSFFLPAEPTGHGMELEMLLLTESLSFSYTRLYLWQTAKLCDFWLVSSPSSNPQNCTSGNSLCSESLSPHASEQASLLVPPSSFFSPSSCQAKLLTQVLRAEMSVCRNTCLTLPLPQHNLLFFCEWEGGKKRWEEGGRRNILPFWRRQVV